MRRALLAFGLDRRGVSAVEFALVAPALVVLVMGTAELGRYGMFRMKLSNATANLANLVTRLETANADQIDGLMQTSPVILDPFDSPDILFIAVSAVEYQGSEDDTRVAWQRSIGDLPGGQSRIGTAGDAARVPPDLVSAEIPTLIVAETMVRYDGWLLNHVVGHTAYDVAFLRPRRAMLSDLQ